MRSRDTEEFRALVHSIRQERADLVAAFPDPADHGFTRWLGVDGVLEYPERLGAYYPPLPPQWLRAMGCSGNDARHHLSTGADEFGLIGELVQIYAERALEQCDGVLDFGCGCGRILRWFDTELPAARRIGAELRDDPRDWCQQNLRATIVPSSPMPPLDLPDDSVDLVYALSVFTHLDREQNDAWLQELCRVCRPGGLMLLTTLGEFGLFVTQRSADHQRLLGVDGAEARRLLRRFEVDPFVFLPCDEPRHQDTGRPIAIFGRGFVEAHWASRVEVLGHLPAVLQLWQDVWVVRPRS